MAKNKKLSVELPEYLITQLEFWRKKFGLSGSQMIMYFCRMGLAQYTISDTTDYLQYLSRQQAKKKGKGNDE